MDELEDRWVASGDSGYAVASEASQPPPTRTRDINALTAVKIQDAIVAKRSASTDNVAHCVSEQVASGLSGHGCESDDRLSQLSSDTVIFQPTDGNGHLEQLSDIEAGIEVCVCNSICFYNQYNLFRQ